MVHGLAVQTGGKFVLASSEGSGTRASLLLPVSTEVPERVEAVSPAASGWPDRAPRQLVVAVDDDPLVLAGTTSMLEDLGHSVLSATSASEALALIRGTPGIGVVISDQLMPGMTGAQLFEVLRAERPELALILASGYADLPAEPGRLALRLAKPFDQGQLSDAMSRALAVSATT